MKRLLLQRIQHATQSGVLTACGILLSAAILAGCAGGAEVSKTTSNDKTTTTSQEQKKMKEPAKIVIHYHRFDGDYEGLGIWTWDQANGRMPAQQEVMPAGRDNFGPYFEIDPALYGPEDEPAGIGFIPRLRHDWNLKDGSDRFWTPNMQSEFWLLGNDGAIYLKAPDITPNVQFAYIDDARRITIKLSHALELGRLVPATFSVSAKATPKAKLDIASVRALDAADGKAKIIEINLANDIDFKEEHLVTLADYRAAETKLRNILTNRELFYSNLPMGALYAEDATTFRVFAPTGRSVKVVLYDQPTGNKGRREFEMEPAGKGIWEKSIAGNLHGRFYMLKVDADGSLANHEVVDVHSRCNTGHDGRGMIVDVRALDPEGFRPFNRPTNIGRASDAIVWEVSVRDFTMDSDSGVPDKQRGKYLGAALRGTTIPGTKIKTGIDHLVELGVTHVQILPIQDFDNREDAEQYNWGYMTSNFSSPDGWFSSNYRNESRVREFKQMVKAFHDAGIRVIMDVVYNHTAPNATFEALVPGYYHRRRDDGSFWNGSGTGNEFRSEAPMARKFVVDSCRYWAEEYGVDGFRFDLMGLVDLETMKEVRTEVLKIDPTLMVYGEPWAAGPNGLDRVTDKNAVSGTGLAAFNDHFRNDLKGAPDGPEPGFVMDGRSRDGLKRGIEGGIHDWVKEPGEAIQYATCHDNLTLWDKILFAAPNATEEDHLRMNMLTIGVLGVSQGIFFLHGGTEIGYDKQGAHNSYDAPDSINSIKWEKKEKYPALFNFTKGIIALRKAHSVFRLGSRAEIESRLKFHDDLAPTNKTVVFSINGEGLIGESWKKCVVLINGEAGETPFRLPEGDWSAYVHGDVAGTESIAKVSGTVVLKGRTMTVLGQ